MPFLADLFSLGLSVVRRIIRAKITLLCSKCRFSDGRGSKCCIDVGRGVGEFHDEHRQLDENGR